MKFKILTSSIAAIVTMSNMAVAETLTIATVNNGDMIRMQKLSEEFTEKTGIDLNWVVLEENILREKVATDIATNAGQYDIMTIGMYETPIWAKQKWLQPLDKLSDSYDEQDILPAIRDGLSYEGTLYAAPFNGESSMVMYRTDLLNDAGLEMPEAPSWDFIREAAQAMTDKENGVYGVCLRGKAGWGENMAFIDAMANSYGARWFDMDWKPQFDSPQWEEALTAYLDLVQNYGPPGASSNGFSENLALFQQGKCGMWIDATTGASFVLDPKESTVAENVGFALAPDNGLGPRSNWLWSWALGIPASTQKEDSARKFIEWATSKDYLELVASKEGWGNVPPGTRTSLYENPDYAEIPFAKITLDSINSAHPNNPTVEPVPYVGIQFVAIPEFADMATSVGQQFSAALAGQKNAKQALQAAQEISQRAMEKAGYIE